MRKFSIEVSEITGEHAGRLLTAGVIDVVIKCKHSDLYTVQTSVTGIGAAAKVLFEIAADTDERVPFVTEQEAMSWLRRNADIVRLVPGWSEQDTQDLGIVKPKTEGEAL